MRKKFAGCLIVAVVAAIALVRAAPAVELGSITLDAKAIAAGEIRTAPLQRLAHAPAIAAYGTVLDPGPLAKLSAALAAAHGKLLADRARAQLARSEERRAAELYKAQHNVSQAAMETARSELAVALAGQATAQAQVTELRARIRADWGAKLGTAIASATSPLPQLDSGAKSLVEVSLPLGQALTTPPTIAAATAPDGTQLKLRLIGRAPRAALGVAGPSLFYLTTTQSAAPIGTPLSVSLRPAATTAGLLVPRAAVVWRDGQALVYRHSGASRFTPVPITTAFGSSKGYFVPEDPSAGLHPGDMVVVNGAALLLSASSSPRGAKKAAAGSDD